jgi:hypothetical protein
MKIFIIILGLLPSVLINAQVINWNNFKEKTMNELMFRKMKEYTLIEGCYSISNFSKEHRKIYMFIKRNREKLLLNDISAKINERIPASCVGIFDSISCNGIHEYQEIASRCITDWTNSPSDAFFMIGWGKTVDVISIYNNRTRMIYLSLVIQANY